MYFCYPQLGVRCAFSHHLTFFIHALSCAYGDFQLSSTWRSQRCFVLKGLVKESTFRTLSWDNFSCFTPRNLFSYINKELASISCSGNTFLHLSTLICHQIIFGDHFFGLFTFATEVCYWITLRDCPFTTCV